MQSDQVDRKIEFQTEIRPLLSRTCFECHGPDEATRRGDLRLDQKEGLFGVDGDGGVVLPGDPASSELFLRITADDRRDLMPPSKSGHALTSDQVEAIRTWIQQGAIWEEHWSFISPEPPVISGGSPSDLGEIQADSAVDPIDRIVQSAWSAEGLKGSIPADRETLLRRVTFDLTGLPPTIPEMESFLADESPAAYDRVVDRLLASSAFGERMATAWLDLARFADTHGYQSDVDRPMWAYRDWVIRTFNENLPYDDFVTWQLAGDLLPDATADQRLATAFNRLHRQTNEGGSVEEEFRVEYVADRVHTFGTAFLGLTTECARCHSHKFDPISHEEYYELFAFFDDIDESGLYSHFTGAVPTPTLLLATAETQTRIDDLRGRIAAAESAIGVLESAESPAFEAWMDDASLAVTGDPLTPLIPGLVGDYPLDEIVDGQLENLADPARSGRVSGAPVPVPGIDSTGLRMDGENNLHFPGVGEFSRVDPFTIALWVRVETVADRAVVLHRSRAWTDAGSQGYQFLLENGRVSWSLIHFWPGDAIGIRTLEPLPVSEWVEVVVAYDGSSRASGLSIHLNGDAVGIEVVRDHLTKAITGGGPGAMTIGQRFRDRGFKGGEVDHLRVFDRRLSPVEIRHLHDDEALQTPDPDVHELRAYFNGSVDPAQQAARLELQTLRRELAGVIDGTHEIMVMAELPEPRESRVLERGRYDRPMQVVQPGTPDRIRAFPAHLPPNRLGLATWVTDPEHPLTARVAVNRLWSIAFGRGIVATPEDFGSQGMRPTHPELLDRLALDFIESGWDVKAMLRRFVVSSTYRQASAATAESQAVDPENLFLSRGPSARLTAEMVRDQALAASGLLVRKVGGPSVHPYQPAGLWQEKSGRVYPQGTGDALHRRSMYTFWKRTSPPPSMMLFDAAKRDVCVARRSSTNTPLQALVLLNDIQFVEAARVLAERVMSGTASAQAADVDHAGQIEHAFRLLTGRKPTGREREILEQLHAEELEVFESDPEAALAVASVGEPPRHETLDPARTAAMTVVCSTIMNTDAAVMKR